MLVVTLAWDQLFLVYDILPATIPPAIVLIGVELWRARRRPREEPRPEPGPEPERAPEPLPSM